MKIRHLLLALAFLFAGLGTLHAQIQVKMTIKRDTFISYEPLVATIQISNFTGRDILLHDSGDQPWFGFQITNQQTGASVAARDTSYRVPPLEIPAGQTVKRNINILQIYPVTDFGNYRVRAFVFFTGMSRYFNSAPKFLSISDGSPVWQQTIGVPQNNNGPGGDRTVTLLKFSGADKVYTYLRIADKSAGYVYCTRRLGTFLDNPQVQIDSQNTIYILTATAPKTYLFVHVGLDGRVIAQNSYYANGPSVPRLVKNQVGDVGVIGGFTLIRKRENQEKAKQNLPKLSEHPANVPKF